MSVCRSSAQLLWRIRPSKISSQPCKRLQQIPSYLRPFHSSRSHSKDQQESSTKESQDVVPQINKAPALRPRADITAEKKRAARVDDVTAIKQHFQPYTDEEINALKSYYTEEQIEALLLSEKAVDVDDLAEQWGERADQWKVDYLDDLSKVDPLIDQGIQLNISDAPQFQYRNEDQFEELTNNNPNFNGLTLTEMLYIIERRSFLSDKVKTGLRTLHRWKGTHKEVAAKRILWRFIPAKYLQSQTIDHSAAGQALRQTDIDTGKTSVEFLFEMVDALEMDDIKKHEILALKHWCGTPKEEALRPMLERTIEEHKGWTDSAVVDRAHWSRLQNLREKELGYDPDPTGNWLVDGRHHDLYDREIFYKAVMPAIPKLKDPRVRYDHESSEDAANAAYNKLSRTMGVPVQYLRSIRVKALVMHRVVNQTRQGKIQSFYVLSVSGNENGLLGIGEGKSAEMEDARLQSRMAALRNLKPIVRYEKRTIYGKHSAKVGGTTVEIAARPPGLSALKLFNHDL